MKTKLYALIVFFLLFNSSAFSEQYPKIDVSGYKKWEYKDVGVSPQTNYFLGLTHLGGYSPNVTGTPWQERLQLQILGQLNEKLTVSYDVEQQPESPDKYDVKVNYDNKHELTFGDFTAVFSGNEFASSTKYLNGVMMTSKDTNYEFLLVPSTKLKSQIQTITSQKGNNTKGPYSLGHGSILENSERIELNGVVLIRGVDYLIDYFEGKVTFNRILTNIDEFKYSYEYTNILDLFFPALSKKDFFGVQGRVTIDPEKWGKKEPTPQPKLFDYKETFPTAIYKSTAESISISIATKEASTSEANSQQLIIDEIMGNERSGKYKLKNIPVVPFSENIIFKGITLKKNEDYAIKYEDGLITLLTPIFPEADDQMQVSYKYYAVENKTENINGGKSKGPYNLTQSNIVPKSEKIHVDGQFVVKDFDYTIDYASGKILFNFAVNETSQIKASYTYIIVELPPPPPPPKFPRSATIGMTYLKESAKRSETSATADYIETKAGSDLIKANNTIYLSKYPVLSSAEGGTITLRINGALASLEVDYSVPTVEVDSQTGYAKVIPQTTLAFINDRSDTSNGYSTGTIKILATMEATSEVTVLYTYKKSIVGKYSGVGNGSRGPYYVKNFRNIVPGSERIEVWTTGSQIVDVFTRNSSFEGDAGDKGYSINYNENNPYVTFNKELDTAKSYLIYFQYVPPQGVSGSDIAQDITGFDGSLKFGEVLQFDGNYARSSTDQIISSVSTVESYSFTAPTNKITLISKPVIENSEKIYVNNYLRNKDIDYFIDYTSGIVTFYYITVATSDAVRVEYQYQSQSGIVSGAGTKADTAYKYGIKSAIGKVSVAYNDKAIGFDFNPLGGTAIGTGSNYKDLSIGHAALAHDFKSNYTYRETNNPIDTTRIHFSRNYDRAYSASAKPLNLADITVNMRNLEVRGDPLSIGGKESSDSSQNSYSFGVTPISLQRGKVKFDQRYDAQYTLSEDRVGFSKNKIKAGHVNYSLGLTDRIKLSTDFQLSEPLTLMTQTGETISSWSLSRDHSYDVSFDLTFAKLQKVLTYAKLINHEGLTLKPTPQNIQTRNTTYHVDLVPITQLTTSYDYNRQETPSVIVAGKNPLNERTALNVKLLPHTALNFSWAHAMDFTINESARESNGRSNTYSADWTPISFEKVKFNSHYSLFNRESLMPSGTLEVITETNTFNQDYSLVLSPMPAITVAPGFNQEDYLNSTSTTPTDLKARNQTVRCKLTFKPLEKLYMDGDYNLKVTTSLNDNLSRHKNNMSFKTGYKVFTWGELVYNLDDENNQGEIQAGGTLPDIDYLKTTNTLSFNFNVPQDNPVLSSILLTAAYKLTKFDNRKNPADNLLAHLMTFEGTLNF